MEGYGKRVLIIDDNEDIQHITSGALMNREYNVFTASDGLEGSELMKKRRYDVVLVDYHMPRLNGLQFIEMSRVMWPETPIILMSGDAWWISRLDSVTGMFGCIGKPFDIANSLSWSTKLVITALRRRKKVAPAATVQLIHNLLR